MQQRATVNNTEQYLSYPCALVFFSATHGTYLMIIIPRSRRLYSSNEIFVVVEIQIFHLLQRTSFEAMETIVTYKSAE